MCKPPFGFGGAFITFSSYPTVEKIDLGLALREKVGVRSRSHWSMSTDFVAVFEKLILPMAIQYQLTQENILKRIFVFSDMQLNSANTAPGRWATSYGRIEKQFQDAGYETPELVFENLAGGRAGFVGGGAGGSGDPVPVAPKPLTTQERGTAIVSGYSQGMLKTKMCSYDIRAMHHEGKS